MKSNNYEPAVSSARYDPFPVELALSTCSLFVSLAGAFWSWKSTHRNEGKREALDLLIESVVELHGTIAEVALLVGQSSEELADDVLHFGKGDIELDGMQFVKYRRIERKLTDLLDKVRKFSLDVRRHAIKCESALEQNQYDEKFLARVDELIEHIGDWTFAELCKAMRDACKELEGLLAKAYGDLH